MIIWDGTFEDSLRIENELPGSEVTMYSMQRKTLDGRWIFDPINGVPVLRIEDKEGNIEIVEPKR